MPINPTNAHFVEEYRKLHQEYALAFPDLVIQLRCHVSDNIIGKTMLSYFRRNQIDLQVVPPDNQLHRRNQAERAGETAKAHIISTVATCSPKFPIESVHLLLQHCELTLNLMRESDIKGISCWQRLRGPLDIVRHNIYPIGCPVAIYDPSHLTWAPRAESGFYLGINHLGFRSHRVLSLSTMAERDSVSLDWLPSNHDVLHYEPLPPVLFTGVILPDAPEDAQFYEHHPPLTLPIIPEGAPQGSPPPPPIPEGAPPGTPPVYVIPIPIKQPDPSPIRHLSDDIITALSLQTAYEPNLPPDDPLFEYASLYLSLYDQKTTGPNHSEWVQSLNDEWHRQLHRAKTLQLYSTDGSIPHGSRVANVSLAARLKYDQHNEIKEYRSRVTWGIEKGSTNHLDSSSTTMSITTFKTLLHSTISQPFKSLATIDIVDFYIQHDAEGTPAYLKTRNGKIPEATRISLGTNHLPHEAIIVFKTLKIIYGQAEAGKISQKHLENHLKANGFVETSTTCLFKSTNPTNDIRIGEWSDDLIIQYDTRTTQLEEFSAMLKKRYPHRLHCLTSVNPTLTYLGYTLTIQRNPLEHSQDMIIASMPHYLKNMYTRLQSNPTSKPKSPSVYIPITYSKEPQLEWTDDSPQASTADKAFLLTAVGSLRYFADGVCPPLILATNKLSSQQSSPTLNTMTNLDRVLNYAYYNQDAALTFYSSNMKQICHSDASYLSHFNSKSYAGGFHTFGHADFTGPDNLLIAGIIGIKDYEVY